MAEEVLRAPNLATARPASLSRRDCWGDVEPCLGHERNDAGDRGIGWPEFQNSEMADLVSFLYFLPFDDSVGDPSRGAEVFRKHACVECHGENGSGGEAPSLEGSGPVSTPSSLVAAMWNHAPTMKTAILGEGRRWPQLTGQDLRDLLALFEDGALMD